MAVEEDSEKTTKNRELTVHYTCKWASGGSKQTSHDSEAFLLCKKHPEGNYSILALRSLTRARPCQGRDRANMSVQREQFPVTRHFLLTTRRNRIWRFRSVLFCDHSKSRKRRRFPNTVRRKSHLRRNQPKHPRWVPDQAPKPKGSLFFRLRRWKLTAGQSMAECTQEDGWF